MLYFIPAICEDNFCLNGGTCNFPNINCICTDEWTGNNCGVKVQIGEAQEYYLLF